ncbi:DNA polymerase III delta prime subunit [Keratinibaculum paraultunense]|uniref:DNA polymerase III subunit delta' n=1 Tax=Keratinibaculum paraultunense TaxID=1278232 RepID=A0A4R3KTU0_9FIRM|nr:DNA polymerase III subunit delta' [Keratinibaculum paraultunense]QQY79871.1 DNA polymerase III subunit delta' [Keratinibaculum paraultunense]TCS88757.1 DNA polymerase III delta prime subunit [Keratinibaculum paraultunense]
MDFNDIIGHEDTIDNLKKAIEKGQIFHSYLFEGEESIGKKKVALSFAKTLLCKSRGIEPCNMCNSCLKFDNFNHPDFILIEPENGIIEKKKIDRLLSKINIAPLESNRKIIIIDDSDTMRMDTQNSLLKTLEEPPHYINIILITSNSNNIIPTILSRCQIINFYPINKNKIEKLLISKYKKTKEEANFIAHFTNGSLGKAITYSESLDFFKLRDETLDIVDHIVRGDKFNIFTSIDFFNIHKDDYEDILDILLYWFRDLILYKKVGSSELLINQDKISLLSKQSFLKEEKINDIIYTVIETKENINRHVNYQLAIETMLLNMQEV